MRKDLAWIEINRPQIKKNLTAIKSLYPNNPFMAMIKCNGYGLGIETIAKTLINEGVTFFGVYDIRDAAILRKMNSEIKIVNFSPRTGKNMSKANTTPVIMSSDEDINNLETNVWVKVNTGLNRWGLSEKETIDIARKLKKKKVKITGLCTTLLETEYDEVQIAKLKKLNKTMTKCTGWEAEISYASSHYVISKNVNDRSIIRVGILLYGIYPDNESENEKRITVAPIFALKSRIYQIRNLERGDSILYKNKFTTFKKMRVALIPLGYSHGYPVQLAGKSDVVIRGNRCRVLGITMSTIVVDVTHVKDVMMYDEVTLIGRDKDECIYPTEVSDIANISSYVLINSFSPTIKRVVVG